MSNFKILNIKFQLSSFQGDFCSVETNFVQQRQQRRQQRVTDGKNLSLKSCSLFIKSPKNLKSVNF
jgi:hypothetical protein